MPPRDLSLSIISCSARWSDQPSSTLSLLLTNMFVLNIILPAPHPPPKLTLSVSLPSLLSSFNNIGERASYFAGCVTPSDVDHRLLQRLDKKGLDELWPRRSPAVNHLGRPNSTPSSEASLISRHTRDAADDETEARFTCSTCMTIRIFQGHPVDAARLRASAPSLSLA